MTELVKTKIKTETEIINTPNFRIYRMPLPTPFAVGRINSYLIESDQLTLIDTGPFTEKTKNEFMEKLSALNFKIKDIKNIFITHGHLDHHGLLNYIQTENPKINTFAHYLDIKKITSFQEMSNTNTEKIAKLMLASGLTKTVVNQISNGYKFFSAFCEVAKINTILTEEVININPLAFEIFHTPGHCDGSICINCDGYLFVGDNILKKISPNPFFKGQSKYLGLKNFTNSLNKIKNLKNIKLILPGHGEKFINYKQRIEEILTHHKIRKEKILSTLKTPSTIMDIINSKQIFERDLGYELFLAIIEIKSHLEVLTEENKVSSYKKNELIYYKINS